MGIERYNTLTMFRCCHSCPPQTVIHVCWQWSSCVIYVPAWPFACVTFYPFLLCFPVCILDTSYNFLNRYRTRPYPIIPLSLSAPLFSLCTNITPVAQAERSLTFSSFQKGSSQAFKQHNSTLLLWVPEKEVTELWHFSWIRSSTIFLAKIMPLVAMPQVSMYCFSWQCFYLLTFIQIDNVHFFVFFINTNTKWKKVHLLFLLIYILFEAFRELN